MSGVLNNTARMISCRAMDKNGSKVTVRLAPGLNDVEDTAWNVVKEDNYVKRLKKEGVLAFGKAQDDLLLEREPTAKPQVKVETNAQLKAALKKAEDEAKEQERNATTSLAKEREAVARAEKAELELAELKKQLAEKK